MGKYRLTNKNAVILLEKRLKIDLNVLDDRIFHEAEIIMHRVTINEKMNSEETFMELLTMINHLVRKECKKLLSFLKMLQDEQNIILKDESLGQLNELYKKEILDFYNHTIEIRYLNILENSLNERLFSLSKQHLKSHQINKEIIEMIDKETDDVKKLNKGKNIKSKHSKKLVYRSFFIILVLLIGYLLLF